jgi:hypothetical protein
MNDYELARAYAPVLCFSQGEGFFPMDANQYLKDCSLHLEEGGNQEKMLLPPGCLNFNWIYNAAFNTRDKFLVYADRRGTSKAYQDALTLLWQPEPLEEAALPEFLGEAAAGVWNVIEDVHEEIKAGVEKVTGQLLRQLAKTKAYGQLLEALERAVGPKVYPDDILDRVRTQYQAAKDPYTYYYRVASGRTGYYDQFVQYWYFYAFNPYINRHEGDWESVTLFFHEDQPVKAFYSSHEGGGEYDWDELETVADSATGIARPVVYAAQGSHANYSSVENVRRKSGTISLQGDLELPRDHFNPGGVIVGAHPKATADWGRADKLDYRFPWFLFEGHWGVNVMHNDDDQLPDGDGGPEAAKNAWDDDLADALIAVVGAQKLAELTSRLRGAPVGPMQHNSKGEWDDPTLLLKPVG